MAIPIIDLFAGPGGLGEGFAAYKVGKKPVFRIGLSVEKDSVAHKTLTLRAVFRALRGTPDVRFYYDYMAGRIAESDFKQKPAVAEAFIHAAKEARCLELGKNDAAELDNEIKKALDGARVWVLIGGPPCQAYSLAGRSRRANDKEFHKDEKHFLYKEYLRIIREHRPSIFVMENVKGLLSSSNHSGDSMFEKIINDLSTPSDDLEYEIRSFVKHDQGKKLNPEDYVIKSELYGVPQARHRVILFGVRKGLTSVKNSLLTKRAKVTVRQAIGSLPKIRSRISRATDSAELWQDVLADGSKSVRGGSGIEKIAERMDKAAISAASIKSGGARFLKRKYKRVRGKGALANWLSDKGVGGVSQHESRSHMTSDLVRYLFAASFAKEHKYSPRLHELPPKLLPNHKNATSLDGSVLPFLDRFRVQCGHEAATTIVSHIAKDGHYYIHYDPAQCRSLTVREAARLQTFPDNYYFEGNRTQQYTQVGNAVPPLLANQLAKAVHTLLLKAARVKRR